MLKKTATALLVDPVYSVTEWEKLHGRKAFGHKNASFSKIAGNTTKYLLSHTTIMSSVMTENEPDDYLIKPECSYLINQNEDGWENEVLKMSYKSFIGAFNFLEHVQNSKHAKGHIIDAILRKITISGGIWVYFVDLLVATDLAHEKLVSDIRSGKTKYMSMGCVTDLVICSYCGHKVKEDGNYCNHLQYNKGQFIPDEDGVSRRVAELCGHKSLPNGGVKFVEASWVDVPAFPGASLREIVANSWEGPKTAYTSDSSASGQRKAASSLILPDSSLVTADLHRLLQ
jgi:hypothetical protein